MEKKALLEDVGERDLEDAREQPEVAPRRDVTRWLWIGASIILAVLFAFQTGQILMLKWRVERLERVMLLEGQLPVDVQVQGRSPPQDAVLSQKLLAFGRLPEPEVVPDVDPADDASELSKKTRGEVEPIDGGGDADWTAALDEPVSSPSRRVRRSVEQQRQLDNVEDGAASAAEAQTVSGTAARQRRSRQSDPSVEDSGRQRTNDNNREQHSRRHNHHRRQADTAFQLTMNVQLYGNDQTRFQRGETVYVTYGEYGPRGFRPTAVDSQNGANSLFPYKMWSKVDWAQNGQTFSYVPDKGHIVVNRRGVYFIYAQLLYHNAAARSGYAVMTNETTRQVLTRCWTSVDLVAQQTPTVAAPAPPGGGTPAAGPTSNENFRFKTCYVGVTALLEDGQPVWLEDLYGTHVKPDADANIFGMIRVVE